MAESDGTAAATGTTDQMATSPGPNGDGRQSASASETTGNGSDGEASFFDPKTIEDKPELMSAYKQMQTAFGKGQSRYKKLISENQTKIDAYDSFAKDPVETLKQLARQNGYSLVQGQPSEEEWNPKTWDDVFSRAKKEAREEIMGELDPMINEIRHMKEQNVEKYLDGKDPNWRQYEDEMLDMLKDHPTLAHDPDKLYRLSVPESVQEQRAIQLAMEKLKGSDNRPSGSNATSNRPNKGDLSDVKTFNDAVELAKKRLASEGIRPG